MTLSPTPPWHSMDRRTMLRTLGLGLLACCNNIDNFDVEVDAKATIPAASIIDELLGTLSFGELESIDLTQELKNQGVTKDEVDSVHLKSFTLSITAPPGQTFDFMESISFFVETDGKPKALVARLDVVPTGKTTIDLTPETALDLAPYVVAPRMKMTTSVKGKRPKQQTTIAAHVVFDVDVNVPGC